MYDKWEMDITPTYQRLKVKKAWSCVVHIV